MANITLNIGTQIFKDLDYKLSPPLNSIKHLNKDIVELFDQDNIIEYDYLKTSNNNNLDIYDYLNNYYNLDIGKIYLNKSYRNSFYINNNDKLTSIASEIKKKDKSNDSYKPITYDSKNIGEQNPLNYLNIIDSAVYIQNLNNRKSENESIITRYSALTALYDLSYCTETFRGGIGNKKITINNISDPYGNNKIDILAENYPVIKAEDCSEDLMLYCVVRGIKIPMAKFETSHAGTSYNYIFRYPEYLLNNDSMTHAIRYIQIESLGSSNPSFYSGKSDEYQTFNNNDYTESLANLNIINNLSRNKVTS